MSDRAEWLKRRRNFLGASEVPAVCGLDPFKTQLDVWAAKKGLITEEDSPQAGVGHLLEPVLLADYSVRTQRALVQPGTIGRIDRPWMSATPDSVGLNGKAWSVDVQVKVVGARMVSRWADGVPDYVQAQVQWELWVTDLPAADVVALLGGTDLQTLPVLRDETAIGYLVEICSRFWRDHIEGDKMPAVDGSETARRVLEARFPRPTAGMAEAVPEFVEIARQHKRLGAQIKALEAERDQLGNAMCLAIGDAAGFTLPGGRVQWKPEAGKPRYKDLAEHLGATADQVKQFTGVGPRVLRVYLKQEE